VTTRYWRKTLQVTVLLLLVWLATTLLTCLFAPELNQLSVLGFPLGFYFAAQGSLIVFLVIVGVYAWYMNRLDRNSR